MASEDYNLERGIVQGSCSWVHDASSSGLSARLQDCNLSEGTYVQNFPPPPPDYIEACRRIDALRRKERSAAVVNLELDRRTRRVCDAALGSSSNNSDVSVMRDEYLEASGPLEPVPILPFLGENSSQDQSSRSHHLPSAPLHHPSQ